MSALSKELKSRLEEKTVVEQELRDELELEHQEKERLDREKEEFKFELELARNEIKTLKQRISTMTAEILSVNTELDGTKVMIIFDRGKLAVSIAINMKESGFNMWSL